MAMETIFNFTEILRLHFIEITSHCQVLQVIMATTRVARRRGCRERLNSSVPYRNEHELNVSDWRQ